MLFFSCATARKGSTVTHIKTIGLSLECGNPTSYANFFACQRHFQYVDRFRQPKTVPVCTSRKNLYTLTCRALYNACGMAAYPVWLEVPYCVLLVWTRFSLPSLGEKVYCPTRSTSMMNFLHPDRPTIRLARRYISTPGRTGVSGPVG